MKMNRLHQNTLLIALAIIIVVFLLSPNQLDGGNGNNRGRNQRRGRDGRHIRDVRDDGTLTSPRRKRRAIIAGEGVLFTWNKENMPVFMDGDDSGAIARDMRTILSNNWELYIVCRVADADQKSSVLDLLRTSGIISKGKTSIKDANSQIQLPEHHILFHTTEQGRITISRQIEPVLHVDSDNGVINAVSRYVNSAIFIKPKSQGEGEQTALHHGITAFSSLKEAISTLE